MEKNYTNNKTLPPLSKKTNLPSIVIPNDENTKNNFSISKSPKKKNNNNNNTISTQNYIDDLKKGTYNILVVVRCRPLSQYENQISNFETIRILDEKMLVLIDPIEYNGPNNIFKNRSREQHYAFDFVFDKFSTQNQIFNNSVKFLIDGVVNGYNATVFAYGATGAGKTYTMTGIENNPGIMPLTLNELFNKITEYSSDREYKIKISYLEIYNENIRDLLRFANNNYNNGYINSNNVNNTLNEELLDLREDPIKGIIITNITELLVNNPKDILSILKRGNRNRTQEATGANETSSRSHAILQISIEFKELHSGISIEIKNSKLSLIDLAGSERASQTQNRGIRLIEGANINRSLLTLGNCINALCETNLKGVKKYIPYRDSKLTRLLKDSLGGNSRTVMIANVSPAINTFDDTYNTLKYANRAKNIKTVVQRNVVNAQYHISNYVNIINSLKKEIFDLKMKMNNNNNNNVVVNSNINNNLNGNDINNNIIIYEKTLKEIKDLCEKNIKLKEKIIKDKIEINSINNNNNNNNFSNIFSDNSIILNKTEINSTDTESNTKNTQINKINNNLNSNEQKLKENCLLLEKTILNCINNNNTKLSENQIDHLKLLIKINQQKLEKLENEFNDNLLQGKNEIKDEYIEQLEKQIMYRDELFIEKNINIFNNNNDNKNNNNKNNSKINKIKTFDEIKNEYDKKLPFINMFNGRKNILMGSKSMNIIPINKYNNYSNNYYNNNINSYGNYYNYCNNYNNFNNFYNKLNQNSSFSQSNNKYLNFFIPKFKKININNKKKLQYSNSTKNIIRNYSQSFKNNNNNNNSVLITTPNKYLNQNNYNNNSNYKQNRYNSINNNNKNFIYGYYNFSKKNITTRFSSKERKNFPTSKIFNNRNKNNNSSRENSLIENSFSNINNNINNNNNFISLNRKNNKSSGNLLTNEQIPQFKKSDLNYILNEKNRKRQKFLDKINGVYDKEML